MGHFSAWARITPGPIAASTLPETRDRIAVDDGELRLSQVDHGSERIYLAVPVSQVVAQKGHTANAATVHVERFGLDVRFGARRSCRRFLRAVNG